MPCFPFISFASLRDEAPSHFILIPVDGRAGVFVVSLGSSYRDPLCTQTLAIAVVSGRVSF
jgi:hypothetical protein